MTAKRKSPRWKRSSKYTAAELSWLRRNQKMILAEYHRAFCEKFGRTDVARHQLNSLRYSRGWKVGYRSNYSKAEFAWLRRNHKMILSQYQRAFCEKFGRTDVSQARLKRLRSYHGWKTGRKPKEYVKKGHPPYNIRPLYSERNKSGYTVICVPAGDGRSQKWVCKNRWLWELQHGSIPRGMVLKCLSDDRANADPSNWEMVPVGVVARLRNRHFDQLPLKLRPTTMAVAKLEHQLREKSNSS